MLDYFKSQTLWGGGGGEEEGRNEPPHIHLLSVFVLESFYQKTLPYESFITSHSPKKHSFPFLYGGGREGGKRKIKRLYQINAFIGPAQRDSSATLHRALPLSRLQQRPKPLARGSGGCPHPLNPLAGRWMAAFKGTELIPAPALGMMSAWQHNSSYGTLS